MPVKNTLLHRLWRYRHFYLFISPFFILFAVLGLYPLIFSLVLSFARWDALTPMKWMGLGNFVTLIHDEIFFTSLWNTLVIGCLYIPPMFIGAFLLALFLNASWLHFRGVYRAIFFMPVVTPMVVMAIVFMLLYGQEAGLINFLLRRVGLEPIPWLVSETWSKPSIAILLVWRWTGYNMIFMLAGLQGISNEYYEAALIDGASAWQRVRYITLPLMRPVFVFCTVMSLIGTVYMFDEVFVLTQGGPGTSSTNFGLYLFNTSFTDFRFGYASCMAYLVAAGVFLASLFVIRFRRADTE